MTPAESATAFARFAACDGGGDDGNGHGLLFALIRFFFAVEAAGLEEGDDGDMLLFQYGVYDWGEGPMFNVDLVRQFITADEEGDDAISQLHVTLFFDPDDALSAIPSANTWFKRHDDPHAVQRAVADSPALAATLERQVQRTAIEWEQV